MKKATFIFVLFALLLALVACGGTSGSGSIASTPAAGTGDSSISLEMKLLIGTFKLEKTDLAVSSDQVSQLLPLWQAAQFLATSDTTAPEEMEAVVDQVKDTMTSQQIEAITAMKLTQQDVMSVMNEKGLTFNSSSVSSTSNATAGSRQVGFPADGGPGPGGDPNGIGGVQQLSPDQIATAQAGKTQSSGMSNQVPASLVTALIELLQNKVQA